MRKNIKPNLPHKGHINTNTSPDHVAGQGAAIKPVIASLAGTVTLVSMSKRPQPPSKPKLERPLSPSGSSKLSTYSQEASAKKTSTTRLLRPVLLSGGNLLSSSGWDEKADICLSEESASAESNQDGLTKTKRKKAMQRLRERRSIHQELMPTEKSISKSTKSSSATSTVSSLKSTYELLEEARDIAAAGPQRSDQQRVPQKTLSEMIRTDSGHTVNVTGTSLQSCDKQSVTEKINREQGEIPREQKPVAETSFEKGMVEKSTCLPVQKMVLNPEEFFQIRTEEKDSSGPVPHHPVLSGSCKVDVPVSQRDPKLYSDVERSSGLPFPIADVDVLQALGASFAPVKRPERVFQGPKPIHSLSLYPTVTPKTGLGEHKSIHHFCTMPASQVLPKELQLASRACHAQSMLMATPQFHQQRAAFRHLAAIPDTHRVVFDGVPMEHAVDTEKTGGVTYVPTQPPDALADWQRIADYYVEKPKMMLRGHAVALCDGQLRMFWNPAPPKFICAPRVIKEKLFAKYKPVPPDLSRENFSDGPNAVTESISDCMEMKLSTSVVKVLFKKHKSLMDLAVEEIPKPSPRISSEDQRRRPYSAPHLTLDIKSSLRLKSDFTTITRELEGVRRQQKSPVCAQAYSLLNASRTQPQEAHCKLGSPDRSNWQPGQKALQHHRTRGRGVRRKLIMRTRVSRFKHRTGSVGKRLSRTKLEYIHKKLNELPRTLTRSESLCHLSHKPRASAEWPTLFHCKSLPLLLDFESFAAERAGFPDMLQPHEWVRSIWKSWFNEVFPTLQQSSTKNDQEIMRTCPVPNEQDQKEYSKDDVQNVDSVDLSETLDEGLTTADVEREVAKLTLIMAKAGKASAFDLCRRGALYKKLGRLNQALEDLNAAISLEPHLLDAYWHRHSIHLMRNNPSSALDDLSFIIKLNQKHADAFKSRAEIYSMRGEITLAISDYTQSIRCRPDDDENYFRRAKLYEKKCEPLLAMEDYAKTFAINPARTDALMTHGLYHFNTSNWNVALEDFSLLLKQEPGNAKARTYRGRICAKLGHFQKAVEDFSLAVHLNPSDWLAFYHRGCLLRKITPNMALRDLSISVLINNSSENLGAFLHRGLLYTKRCQWQEAKADFEAVIKIDRTVAVAYMNLGIIYMQKLDQNYKAIKMFTKALKVNPTHIRGYICRSTAYRKVNDLKRALKDLTRAIHISPDAQYLYILRGQCLCDMEKFELATLCIEYTAEINKALGLSVVQQAAVQSFLQNHAKAIDCLVVAASANPSFPILILLGKTQMKAKRFMEAVESFRKALSFLSPSQTKFCNVPEASELFYLTGMCYMAQEEGSLLPQALDAFSSAVRLSADYADAYHQRGLCRMRLQHSSSVEDFNRALHINPNFFQAYLSRALFYAARGRYSKAVYNCNEAIKIQPNSVRAYLYRGVLKFYMKVYGRAVEDLTTAIKIDNTCVFAYYNRAVCYQQLKEYELALRDYGIVVLLPTEKETDLKALINRALIYVELDDFSSALQDFKAVAMKQPEDSAIYQALGICHHRLGQLQEAVDAYSKAIGLNSFLLEAYVGRGNVFMDYGNAQAYKQAQRDFLSALHLNPLCDRARVGLAYNFQIFGRFQRAWNQFTVALEVNPKCWAAYEGRAVVNLHMGSTFGAFQDINSALKCNSCSDHLFTNRGVIYQLMGDNASAMRDYQKAISINPSCALAFFNSANLLFYNRQLEQACEYYSQAIKLDPSDETAILNRAITHALLWKIPESLIDFSEALRLSPQSAHVYFNRANLYSSLKKYKSAEKDLTQALHLQPDDALLYKLRADVRGHLGLIDQAIQDYRTALELQDTL